MVINGSSHIQTWCSPAATLHIPAYESAFQRGDIHRLGDSTLEKALFNYASGCKIFNYEMRWIEELVKEKHGSGLVPLEIAKALVQPRLPVLDELIDQSWKLLRMMNEDLAESDTPSG